MKHFAIFLLTLQRQSFLRHAKTNKRDAITVQMEQVFSYIISLGASVMMPILFTIIGLCIGLKFGRSLKSGLYVGVGFVGLGIVTALLTTNFGGPLSEISQLYDLQLKVFDMGWPAAAAVLALCLYRCCGLFRDGPVAGMGLFRSNRVLHHHAGDGRSDC